MVEAPDGHIYSFPWIEQLGEGKEAIQAIGDIPYINKKWLDFLGLEVPTTTEELEQALIAFRDNADALEKEFNIEGRCDPDVVYHQQRRPGSGDFDQRLR